MFPAFFAAAPVITLHDPLANFLGASTEGVLEYRYEDVVRLCGHSCPTVASAFLLARAALRKLYGETLPTRGDIRVELAGQERDGVQGVIAAVLGLITGAAAAGGFRGLAGQFNRRDLLAFQPALPAGAVRLTRLDSGKSVAVVLDLTSVPGDARMSALLPRCLQGVASHDERQLFQQLWQERVRALLLDYADDPCVFQLYEQGA